MSDANRRRLPRRKADLPAKVGCFAGEAGTGPDIAVRLLDVSVGGVQMVLKEELLPGHEIHVQVERGEERRARTMPARVLWCVPLADGDYGIGAMFLKPLSSVALRTFART